MKIVLPVAARNSNSMNAWQEWLSCSLIMRLLLLLIVALHVVAAQEVPVFEVSGVEFPTSNKAAARLDKFTIPETTTGLTACGGSNICYITLLQFNASKLSYNS